MTVDFESQVTKVTRKLNRSLRRLCRLKKERAGRERLMKAFESFSRTFGEMKAYALAYLIIVKLDAASVMEVRNDLRQATFAYMKMRENFCDWYDDISKVDKSLERKFTKTNRVVMHALAHHAAEYENDPCN